jgi:drug/metabolite transporter (DMT)-like permease
LSNNITACGFATGAQTVDWKILIAITVLSWGGYNVLLKWAGGQIAWQASMLLFVIAYSIIVGAYCILEGRLIGADLMGRKSILPLLAGTLCALGAITFFKALPMAPGSLLMPLVGLYTFVSAIGCLFLFHEPISLRVVAGMLCAAGAVVLLGR